MSKKRWALLLVWMMLLSSCVANTPTPESEAVADNGCYPIVVTVNDTELAFVGLWQKDAPDVGAGYDSRLLLLPDHTFVYAENQHLGAVRLRYAYGDWSVEEDVFNLVVKSKVFKEGGKEIEGSGAMLNSIEGGHLAIHIYSQDDYEYVTLPFSNIETEAVGIGGEMYHKLPYDVCMVPRAEIYELSALTDLFEYRQVCLAFGS